MGVNSQRRLNSIDAAAVLRRTNAIATAMALSVLFLSALVALRVVPGGIGPQLPVLADGLFFLGVLELVFAPVLFRVLFRDLASFQSATIVTFALRESVGLYGFLLYRGWLYRGVRAQKARRTRGIATTDLLDDLAARRWIAVVVILGAILILITGWYGGVLVYEFGVNVAVGCLGCAQMT